MAYELALIYHQSSAIDQIVTLGWVNLELINLKKLKFHRKCAKITQKLFTTRKITHPDVKIRSFESLFEYPIDNYVVKNLAIESEPNSEFDSEYVSKSKSEDEYNQNINLNKVIV